MGILADSEAFRDCEADMETTGTTAVSVCQVRFSEQLTRVLAVETQVSIDAHGALITLTRRSSHSRRPAHPSQSNVR